MTELIHLPRKRSAKLEPTLLQALVYQHKPVPIPIETLHLVPRLIVKNIQSLILGIALQLLYHIQAQAIDRFAHVHRLQTQIDTQCVV